MKQLRIHYFQHVTFEGLGYIETWATQNGHLLSSTKFFEDEFTFPNLCDFDWLIIMGGPMGVYDEEQYTWLKSEKEFILKNIEAQKTVIGICLGSQLLASALGAKVFPNKKKEIGWFPLTKTNEGKANNLLNDLPDEFTTFHWHGDTFDLPSGATHLLKTDICNNQAFLYKENVLGLQFHLEVTPQTLISMIDNGRHELKADDFIQTEAEILKQADHCYLSNEYLSNILTKLADKDKNASR
ncbi:MAG: type 1 glutamine amidotransferase [Ignavibacteriales bacterium]|nr:type 1 glutamine amidotransferase [Ignavibacteriales bacterium]